MKWSFLLIVSMPTEEMDMNYQYDFVRIEPKGWMSRQPETDYHQIVEKRAKLGWRLVTVVTPPSEPSGMVGYYELIFERPA